jgi:hypothetical protein
MIKRPAWLSIAMAEYFSMGFVTVVIIGVFLLVRGCHREPSVPDDKLSPEAKKIIRMLDSTAADWRREADSLRTVVVHDTVRAVSFRTIEDRTKVSAAVAERLADSLSRTASSAEEWHAAHDARKAEADTLKLALVAADSVADAERHARVALGIAYGADTLRRVALERLTSDLRTTIGQLEKPCRIVWKLGCPSRTTTAGAGLLLGLLGGRALK